MQAAITERRGGAPRRTGEQIDFPCIARGERGRLQEINVLRSGLHGVYE